MLDAEMKYVHRLGITNQKEEKSVVTDEEEDTMWQDGLLGINVYCIERCC